MHLITLTFLNCISCTVLRTAVSVATTAKALMWEEDNKRTFRVARKTVLANTKTSPRKQWFAQTVQIKGVELLTLTGHVI